jgi:cell division protein FtsI (penicillin-binding protein 3)
VLLALSARLVDIQVLRSTQYRSLASQELSVPVTVRALRGGIFDRSGQVLALSVPTSDVYADDFQVKHPDTEALALSPLLQVPAATLSALLQRRSGYVALARQVPQATAKKIAAAAFPGITLIDDSIRQVPNGALASPVLGMTNGQGAGAAGLEYRYERLLSGSPGHETIYESPSGVALPGTPVRQIAAAVPGVGLELTLDEPLQFETEHALAAQISATHALSGTAVVMDVRTGEILSMASLVANQTTASGSTPSAPASTAAGALPVGASSPVSEAPTNLATDQPFEPGSVFKLVTFSAALQDGIISPTTVFSVPDHITLDGSVFHDAEPHPTETLSATQILAQSSNIGTSEIARQVGEARLLAQVSDLGFGLPTGLHFPGETQGLLTTSAQWQPTDLVSLPIGQVDAVTAQQLLDAYNTVANGGVFVAPRLVRATVAPNGKTTAAPASSTHTVFSPATDAELVSMLEQVVNSGTGTNAVVPGYTVAGKTGTAQIPTPGHDSYVAGAYMSSFVGFAPANHPVLSAIVVLNRPTPIFGGTVAAPVFAQIMSYALHRYDIPTTPNAPVSAQPQGGTPVVDQAQDIT